MSETTIRTVLAGAPALEATWDDDSDLYLVDLRPLLGLTVARVYYLSGPGVPRQLICRFARRGLGRAKGEAQAVIDGEQERHARGKPARVTWICRGGSEDQ